MGGLAVGERSLIWRAGGEGCCCCWGGWTWAPAEAIGSVRGAVSGVGVGWAELRIAVRRERGSQAVVFGYGLCE